MRQRSLPKSSARRLPFDSCDERHFQNFKFVKTEFDIIVVGGGGSGLAAAVSGAEHGSDVILLEKRPELGGTTGIAVGSFTASRTSMQARAGIADDLESHCIDAGRFPTDEIESRNNDQLRRFFLSQSATTLDWLIKMGLAFHGPSPEPPNRVPRMHNVIPGAKAYIATLQGRFLKLGGTILVNSPVTRLIRNDATNTVTGVTAMINGEEVTLTARRGIVLAAGDYANSPEMIRRFKGDRYAQIEGINPHAGGDGHRLAESVQAKLLNMDVTYGPELRFVAPQGKTFQQLLPTSGPFCRLIARMLPIVPRWVIDSLIRRLLVTWQHPEDALFDDGAILVNRRGERFCDETIWPEREIAVATQPAKEAFILLDSQLAEQYSRWPNFISTAPKIAYAYVNDYLKLRPDVACDGDSLDVIATKSGLPATNLRGTVDTCNAEAKQGSRRAISGPRWVLLGPVKAWFTTTEGGAAINQQLQVLDLSGKPIPGLYAVGQTGLGGQVLWGHGLHIAWAMTSGRLVGQLLGRPD